MSNERLPRGRTKLDRLAERLGLPNFIPPDPHRQARQLKECRANGHTGAITESISSGWNYRVVCVEVYPQGPATHVIREDDEGNKEYGIYNDLNVSYLTPADAKQRVTNLAGVTKIIWEPYQLEVAKYKTEAINGNTYVERHWGKGLVDIQEIRGVLEHSKAIEWANGQPQAWIELLPREIPVIEILHVCPEGYTTYNSHKDEGPM